MLNYFNSENVVTNDKGAAQSHTPCRFDIIPPIALFEVAKVLAEGAEKYGAYNWKNIDINDHLNHAIQHVYGHLSGDRTEEHLSHAICRLMFALELFEEDNG
jgi:hypothetical protein